MAGGEGLRGAEVYVLLSLPRFDARKALKLGFMGAIAQGLVRMESVERRVLLRKKRFVHLYAAPGLTDHTPLISASLLRVVRTTAPDGSMSQIIAASKREYGNSLSGFL